MLDASNPARYWVGLEVGGVLSTPDDGSTWTSVMTGGDIHVMAADPARAGVLYMTTGFGRYPDDPQPREERIAGAFRSKDGGKTWEYLWKGIEPPYTRPMCVDQRAPFALVDSSLSGGAMYATFTLGGLVTAPGGEVRTPDGGPVPGLYAAGRTAALFCGSGYPASGISLADASFFGRRAGVAAAKNQTS